jgi:hypothetical protein
MKALKRILIGLVVLVVVLLGISQLLPGRYHVERSVSIKAKPDAIFPLLTSLKRWPEWSAWTTEKYPNMKYTYEGPETGVGAISKSDDPSGSGLMKLTLADSAKGVEFDMSFNNGEFLSKGGLTFSANGDETVVRWSHDGEVDRNPIHRFFALLMDKMVGKDFETGLNKLKAKVESGK